MNNFDVHYSYRDAPTLNRFRLDRRRNRLIVGPFRCLSGDTEFLTPDGWISFDQYDRNPDQNILIAQFIPHSKRIFFGTPSHYVKEPCDFFYHLKNHHGIDQLLSPNHTILYNTRFQPDRWQTITAEMLAEKHNQLSEGWSGRIPTTFHAPDQVGLEYTDDEIRLIVAVSADGNFPTHAGLDSTRCRICVRKQRKKERLRDLLARCDLEWREDNSPDRPTETRFSFYAPSRSKNLWDLFRADGKQLSIIADEIPYWDGHFHEDGGIVFSSTVKENADFAQYVMACSGMRATIAQVDYPEHPQWKSGFRVYGNAGTNDLSLRGAPPIEKVSSSDGFQYCFNTETGFFVARRIGKIFVTGNSGKSSCCTMEIYRKACEQAPDSRGRRRTRWAVVRNTYPELRDTTIKTVLDWFPPEYFGSYRSNPTPEYQIQQKLSDGTVVECELLFRALDRPDHVKNLLSLEVTGAWFNEAREIEKIIVDTMDGRINQYPSQKDGGATWGGMFLDTNPCDTDHWLYKLYVEKLPNSPKLQEFYGYYHQPSGLSAEAENLTNLPRNYYQNLAVGKDNNYIKVYIEGRYGYVREGKIIYTNYNDLDHCSLVPLEPWRGLHLTLGWDFGLTPACVLTQFHPRGNLHVLREICATEMGVKRLARDVVRPFLIANFNGYRYVSGCDPSGAKRSEIDETKSCYKELKESGFPVKLAFSNNLEPRFTSVDNFLLKGKIEGKPAFQIDPSCTLLRKGFNGEYKRRKLNVVGAEVYADAPEKNSVSHPHEALQYACMTIERGITPDRTVSGRGYRQPQPPPPVKAYY